MMDGQRDRSRRAETTEIVAGSAPMLSRRAVLVGAAGAAGASLLTVGGSLAQGTPAAGGTPFGEPTKTGGTYIVALGDATGNPRDFIPTSYYGTTAFFMCKLLFTPLVQLDSNWMNPGPGLATDWQWSSDHRQLTLNLRKGVTFHDGSPFTAKDVEFTYKLMVRNDPYPAVNDITIFEGGEEYKAGKTDEFAGVTVVDDSTIRFNLIAPSSTFLTSISNCGILPAAAFGADALTPGIDIKTLAPFDGNVIGTGPFKIKNYDAQSALTLEANKDFFRGAPVLDGIIFRFGFGGPAAVSGLLSGEVDGSLVGGKDAASLRDRPSLDLKINYALANQTALLCATEKEYLNTKVLQGLLTAIDVDSLIKTVLYDFSKPSPSIMMHPSLFPNPDLPAYPYDVEKAKALLQEGKWDSSRTLKLGQWVQQGVPSDTATAVLSMWQAAGVDAEFLPLDSANMFDIGHQEDHEYDIALSGLAWTAYDPSSAYISFACEKRPDYSNYCNPDFDSAMKEAVRQGDLESAKPFFQKAQTILQTDLPYAPMTIDAEIFALSKKVHGGVLGRGPLNNVQPELWWKE